MYGILYICMYLHFPVMYHKHQPNVYRWIFTLHGSYGIFLLLQPQAMEPEHIAFRKFLRWLMRGGKDPTKWAPSCTSYKWGYNSYHQGYNLSYPSIGHLQGLFHSIYNWILRNAMNEPKSGGFFKWTCSTHHWNPVHKQFLAVHPFCWGFFLPFNDEKIVTLLIEIGS